MARISRFQLQDSDRDGFTRKKQSLVKDSTWKVGAEELDTPPPSRLPLGGEGEANLGDAVVANSFGVVQVTSIAQTITYVTAAGGITPSFATPWMYVVGSLENITVTANPQIAVGTEAKQLTLYGVGSTIRLAHGTGLILVGSAPMVIGSGDVVTFMYDTGNTAWRETSRGKGV